MITNLAVQRDTYEIITGIQWWPSLLRPIEGAILERWRLLSFPYHVQTFLVGQNKKWCPTRLGAVSDLVKYCEEYANEELWVSAMAQLIASDPDLFTKIERWMQRQGADLGMWSDGEPFVP